MKTLIDADGCPVVDTTVRISKEDISSVSFYELNRVPTVQIIAKYVGERRLYDNQHLCNDSYVGIFCPRSA